MTKIKICGLQSLLDISYVNLYQPDYVGFVFAKSKRQIDDTLARQLKNELADNIQAVGVFVNDKVQHIVDLCKENIIDIVQLHGDEDEVYIRELRRFITNPIIKAVRVQSMEQILKMQKFPCNHLLLDTYSKENYGGSGRSFDRTLIPKDCKPFFLAGGLNTTNIKEAIHQCHPYCIDLSSGVETDHKKDKKKIKEVIKMVHIMNNSNLC